MLRSLLPLALASVLFSPIAASAQAPTPPAAPTAPAAAPLPAKKHDRMNGKISSVDAAARTITIVTKKKTTVLTLTSDAKIFKPGDKRKSPMGAFSDLLIDTPISAHVIDPAAATLTADEVRIRKPKTAMPMVPTVPATPAK